MMCRLPANLLVLWSSGLLLLVATAPAPGFFDRPAEGLTLPRILLECRSVAVVQVDRVDLDKGGVRYKLVQQVQGPRLAGDVKHAIKLGESVPPELKTLKTGQQAVFFSGDGYGRGVLFVEGAWYMSVYDDASSWWHIAYTASHYDFNCAFAGSFVELIEAIQNLLKGREVVIRCRQKSRAAETQWVRCSLREPHRKIVVQAPAAREPKVERTSKLPLAELLKQLKDQDATLRVEAALALAPLRAESKTTVPALAALLVQDKDPFVRRAAAVALGEIGPEAQTAVPNLIALVQSQYESIDGLVGSEAQVALTRIDPEGKVMVPLLTKQLKAPGAEARMNAAGKLAIIGPTAKAAIPALIEAMTDKEGGIRYEVVGALVSLRAEAKHVVPVFAAALKDENEHVRRAAVRALGGYGPEAKESIPALTAALQDKNDEVRAYAAESLKKIQPKQLRLDARSLP